MKTLLRLLALGPVVALSTQCASVKPQGSSPDEQRDFIDKEAAEIVAKLEKQKPDVSKEIATSEGYAAFRYASGKLPLILSGIGAGSGFGVAVDQQDESRTYMKVRKLNWGLGTGVKDNSVVFVFTDRAAFDKFRTGKWDGGAAAEATVKAGEMGGDVGGVATVKKGYHVYTLTDSGLSYGVTWQTRRFSPISSLNK